MLSYGAAGFTVSQGHWAEAARVQPITASALLYLLRSDRRRPNY